MYLQNDNAYILTQVGNAYWANENFHKARESLQKAYLIEPNNANYFLNYYEISLVTLPAVKDKERSDFLDIYKDDKKAMLVYEMLSIIEFSIENKETDQVKEAWLENFKDEHLDWSFQKIRSWLDQSDLTLEHQQEIQANIGFFIGYQQAYNLQHQSSLPQEVYQ